MKATEIIKKRVKSRILFISVRSFLISSASILIFYTLFLIIPGPIIRAGIISSTPLIILTGLLIILPLLFCLSKYPFRGEKFFNSIISGPYTSKDIKAAVELDSRKGYPDDLIKNKGTFSEFLSEKFSEKISSFIIPEKKIFEFSFSKKFRTAAFGALIIIASLLSFIRINFLVDIITALMTGLPVELISIGPVIKFNKIEAHIIPPAYLDSEDNGLINLKARDNLKVLEGSKIVVKGELDNIINGRLFYSTQTGLEYFQVNIRDGKIFEVSFLAPGKGAFALEFERTEHGQKEKGKSKVYKIEAYPDNPPKIEIFAPEKNHKIVYGNSFGISFTASDDYGILEIYLCHRLAGSNDEYYRELITRFPREITKNHTTTYIWNPILREGEKFQELIYHPGTEMVEYFIEVRDINVFSSKGIAKSDIRFVSFTSIVSKLKNAADLIKELSRNGKELLEDINNDENINSYDHKLGEAIKTFSNELRDVLPQNSLIYESLKMKNIFSKKNRGEIQEPLKSYVKFLDNYLTLLEILMSAERYEAASGEINHGSMQSGEGRNNFQRLSGIVESLGKEIFQELEEIQKLIDSGDNAKAGEKMAGLIEKIRKKLKDNLERAKAEASEMAKDAIKKLKQIQENAKERIKEQKRNIALTKEKKIKQSISLQGNINPKLEDLHRSVEKLTSEIPVISPAMSSYSKAAAVNGEKALSDLEDDNIIEALGSENRAVNYLESLLENSLRQMEQLEEMAKGNFDKIMPQGRNNWFVYIPKEAVYNVPIKYKDRIIDMSKKRGKSTEEKENFWRELLE